MWSYVYSTEQIGEFVKEARRERGLTQDELAERLQVSHATVSKLETGKNTSTKTMISALLTLGYCAVVLPKGANVVVGGSE